MMKNTGRLSEKLHRVIAFLTRAELDFVDRVAKDILFSSGTKLSRSKIISAIINVLRQLDIDASGANSKEKLEQRVLGALKGWDQKVKGEGNAEHL